MPKVIINRKLVGLRASSIGRSSVPDVCAHQLLISDLFQNPLLNDQYNGTIKKKLFNPYLDVKVAYLAPKSSRAR